VPVQQSEDLEHPTEYSKDLADPAQYDEISAELTEHSEDLPEPTQRSKDFVDPIEHSEALTDQMLYSEDTADPSHHSQGIDDLAQDSQEFIDAAEYSKDPADLIQPSEDTVDQRQLIKDAMDPTQHSKDFLGLTEPSKEPEGQIQYSKNTEDPALECAGSETEMRVEVGLIRDPVDPMQPDHVFETDSDNLLQPCFSGLSVVKETDAENDDVSRNEDSVSRESITFEDADLAHVDADKMVDESKNETSEVTLDQNMKSAGADEVPSTEAKEYSESGDRECMQEAAETCEREIQSPESSSVMTNREELTLSQDTDTAQQPDRGQQHAVTKDRRSTDRESSHSDDRGEHSWRQHHESSDYRDDCYDDRRYRGDEDRDYYRGYDDRDYDRDDRHRYRDDREERKHSSHHRHHHRDDRHSRDG